MGLFIAVAFNIPSFSRAIVSSTTATLCMQEQPLSCIGGRFEHGSMAAYMLRTIRERPAKTG